MANVECDIVKFACGVGLKETFVGSEDRVSYENAIAFLYITSQK